MSHLSTSQLAELAGLTKRQVQRILDHGKPDLGATRTPGGHWRVPDSVEVRRWAKNHQRWKREGGPKVRLNPRDKSTAIVTIEGVSLMFDLWHRKMEETIPRWSEKQITRALELLEGPARMHAELLALRDGRRD